MYLAVGARKTITYYILVYYAYLQRYTDIYTVPLNNPMLSNLFTDEFL